MPALANQILYGASGTAVSGTTTYYSEKTSLRRLTDPSYQLKWTGTPTGTFTVWVSNLAAPSEADDTDWVQLTLSAAITQPAGSASKDYVELSSLSSLWVRLKYVNAASTGTIFAWFNGKGN